MSDVGSPQLTVACPDRVVHPVVGSSYCQMAPSPSTESLTDMPATVIVDMLCSRQLTARHYLESLYDKLYAQGYSCLNAFQYVNVSRVRFISSAWLLLHPTTVLVSTACTMHGTPVLIATNLPTGLGRC